MSDPKKLTYCFDIDGTLCTNTEGDYEAAEVLPGMVARVNALYDSGCRILLNTTRGSTTGICWRELTERQLAAWGFKYHELFLGKPTADVYVDDKAVNIKDWDERTDHLRFGKGAKVAVAERASVLSLPK